MGLGGGTFINTNKAMPGSYINFVSSKGTEEILGDRGIVALPVELDWGIDGEVFSISNEEFSDKAKTTFGYAYTADEMKGLRDLFKNAKEVFFYRLLNAGLKASNTFGTAKYKGIRGNSITIIIAANADEPTDFDVTTIFDGVEVDNQTVSEASALVDNEYVDWKTSATLAATAGLALTGGSNGDAVTGTQYQDALDAFEACSFNALGCLSIDDTIKDVFVAYTKRLRDEHGVKFQTIVYKREAADYEGVISVENTINDTGAKASSLVYWSSGACAGTAVNKSATNMLYDGEYSINVNFKQSQLEEALEAGKFIFHSVGKQVRVLRDINTLTSFTEEKTEGFSNNQTIRVIDQIANDISSVFNTKYLGLKPNDADSRISLWNDIVTHHRKLESFGAIEGFSADNVTVVQGEDKKTVLVEDVITVANAMDQLYMLVVVQ